MSMKVLWLGKSDKPMTLAVVEKCQPKVILCLEYPYILSKEILEYPEYGCINAHYSLLPKYRGRHPIQWAMINGEKEVGVTAHYMTEEVDAGDVICQLKMSLNPNMPYRLVHESCYVIAYNMLSTLSELLARGGTLPRVAQDHSQATQAPMRKPEDSELGAAFQPLARKLACFINAMSHPMPNAYIERADGRIYFTGARYEERENTK